MQNFCISHEEAPRNVKTLRNQCAVVILTLTLAISAYAGQIQCPGAVTDTTDTPLLSDELVTTVVTTVVTVVSPTP